MITHHLGKGKKAGKGMSLMELAIALCVMGLVLATLWSIVGTIWNSYQEERTQRQVLTVVQNVRDYYQNANRIPCATNNDITDDLDDDDRRLIPTEMRETPEAEGGDIYHALAAAPGGSFKVTCLDNGRSFRIELSHIKRENCIGFYMGFPALSPELGVKNVLRPDGTVEAINFLKLNGATTNTGNSATAYPMNLTTANNWCAHETNNKVGFDFKLRN